MVDRAYCEEVNNVSCSNSSVRAVNTAAGDLGEARPGAGLRELRRELAVGAKLANELKSTQLFLRAAPSAPDMHTFSRVTETGEKRGALGATTHSGPCVRCLFAASVCLGCAISGDWGVRSTPPFTAKKQVNVGTKLPRCSLLSGKASCVHGHLTLVDASIVSQERERDSFPANGIF